MQPRSSWRGLFVACLLATSSVALADNVVPITDPEVNSPKEALRQQIFGATVDKPGCLAVKASPNGATALDPSLSQFLQDVIAAVKAHDSLKIQPLFHKRLNVSMTAINETFAKLNNVYGTPYDASMYRLWALNSVDGKPMSIPCDTDNVSARAMYGYPLQFAAWLQIMGPNEIGRVYVSIVPADGKWNLGAFHAQQWTHASKDFVAWAAEGARAQKAGLLEAAYVDYDITAKLLDSGNFLELQAHDEAIKARDAAMSTEAWDKSLRDSLKDFNVLYTSTLLVVGGTGVLVRVRVPEEISTDRIKSQCAQIAQKLMLEPWTKEIRGVRCNFNLPVEDPKKDGALGGMFIAFDDLRSSGNKKK